MEIQTYDNTTFGPRALMSIYEAGNQMLDLREKSNGTFKKNFYGDVEKAAHKLASTHDSLMADIEKLMNESGNTFIPSFSLQAALDALQGYAVRLGEATIFPNESIEENFWSDLSQLAAEMATHDHAKCLADFTEKCGL